MEPSAVKKARVMIVDDDPANVRLVEKLLEIADFTDVVSTTDSSAVVSLCAEIEPDLIVLDLHMPDPDGFELLGMLAPWIRGSARLPILVATADITPDTKRRALAAGARDFLTKPLDPSEVIVRIENLLDARVGQLELRRQIEALEQSARGRARELMEAEADLAVPLAAAAEYRDEQSPAHTLRIGRTSALLAGEIGLPDETIGLIALAARLHDVGNVGLSDAVLLKPGTYTPGEFELMKSHAAMGAEILDRGRSRLLKLAAEIARTHHERWDGSGYPAGLSGEEIPMSGRIVGLADVFEALCHPRPYREAKALAEVVPEIRGLSGHAFDPRVVSAFLALDHAQLLAPVSEGQAAG
jgi:putative two-component system response regulator